MMIDPICLTSLTFLRLGPRHSTVVAGSRVDELRNSAASGLRQSPPRSSRLPEPPVDVAGPQP